MDKNTPINNLLSSEQREELLGVLKTRFEKHMYPSRRHGLGGRAGQAGRARG